MQYVIAKYLSSVYDEWVIAILKNLCENSLIGAR